MFGHDFRGERQLRRYGARRVIGMNFLAVRCIVWHQADAGHVELLLEGAASQAKLKRRLILQCDVELIRPASG